MKLTPTTLVLLLVLQVTSHSYLNAQSQFRQTIGGTGNDQATSIILTADSGYVVAGFTSSYGAGGFDMYIVKFDTGNTLQWSKTLGGTNADYGLSTIQTRDGGYAVAG